MIDVRGFTDLLKSAGLISLPFTIYFAWMKIGHRVAAIYSWRVGPLIASGIGTVTLINLKDRPLAIFDIHAVMDGLSFGLKEFRPPLILKALEACTIEIDSVSERYVGPQPYDWKPKPEERDGVDIYISTFSKQIKCLKKGTKTHLGFAIKRRLKLVTTGTSQFNGLIYNKNAKFAITYTEDKQQKTALIDAAGVIHWDRTPNGLRPSDIKSPESVKNILIECGVAPLIAPFVVEELHKSGANKNRNAVSYYPPGSA